MQKHFILTCKFQLRMTLQNDFAENNNIKLIPQDEVRFYNIFIIQVCFLFGFNILKRETV